MASRPAAQRSSEQSSKEGSDFHPRMPPRFLSFLSAWLLKKIKHGRFHLGRISIPGRPGGCDWNVKAGATELEGKGGGTGPGGPPPPPPKKGPRALTCRHARRPGGPSRGRLLLARLDARIVGKTEAEPGQWAGSGSRTGGGGHMGQLRAETESAPQPHPLSLSFSSHLLNVCVPPMCQALSWVLGGGGGGQRAGTRLPSPLHVTGKPTIRYTAGIHQRLVKWMPEASPRARFEEHRESWEVTR